jgi:hypothetical protein
MNNKKMIIIKMKDKYNLSKTWIVKVYKCGKVYLNQEIHGFTVYKRDWRTTKKHLKEFIHIDIYKNSKNPNKVIDCTVNEKTGISSILVETRG